MISPIQVVHQVLEGRAPTTWFVLRRAPLSGAVLRAKIRRGLVSGVWTTAYGAILIQCFAPFFHLRGVDLLIPVVFLFLLVSALVSIYAVSKHYKMKGDLALILLPEGVVSCEHVNDDVKRSINVIEYENVKDMKWHAKSISRGYQTRASLAIQYQDGRWTNWYIDDIYGPSDRIAQRVIKDHHRFSLSHPGILREQ